MISISKKKDKDFVKKSDSIIDKGLEIIDRRFSSALSGEKTLEELLTLAENLEDISPTERKSICTRLKDLELEKVTDIARTLSTIFDKKTIVEAKCGDQRKLEIVVRDAQLEDD